MRDNFPDANNYSEISKFISSGVYSGSRMGVGGGRGRGGQPYKTGALPKNGCIN